MKKLLSILALIIVLLLQLNAQTIMHEDFETSTVNSFIAFQTTGTFNSQPGIKNNPSFGSNKVFGFGSSTCGSNCFSNFKTTLIITFSHPTFVNSIMWKEMEINGNWGSQGVVLLDDIILTDATIGALPVNSYTPDALPRNKDYAVNKLVKTIKLEVSDITNSSEIIIDDLRIKSTQQIAGYEYWFNNNFANKTITTVNLTPQLFLNETIPTVGLSQGVNTLNFRTFNNFKKYSSIVSYLFYKTSAQESNQNSNIVAYEYWLDNDFKNAISVNSPVQKQINITELLSMGLLPNGLHNFNMRFKDNTGLWSSITSSLFYKTSAQESNQNSNIVAYEYWLDNDFKNAILVNSPVQKQINITELLSMGLLANGLHNFNMRFKNNTGLWSSITSSLFYKTSTQESNQNSNIVAYEYWLDNDFKNAILVNSPVQKQINITELLSMGLLANGLHNFNIRFKNNTGLWSSITNSFFYKTTEQILPLNTITQYRYWFNNDFTNAVNVSLTTSPKLLFLYNLDLTQLPKGNNEINFQFKDSVGKWSAVISSTIEKKSLPIAHFLYSTKQYCDSTVVTFVDKSIDADTYLFDFGDGVKTDSIPLSHTYYTPATYQVSLTVKDTTLNKDSSIVIPIEIFSLHSASTISKKACNSYIAADGQVYTTSGTKTAVIPNVAGCDSTITINLIIESIDVSVTQNGGILAANATGANYQWLDCNKANSIINGEIARTLSVTKNGSYAVEVTQNNCVDTSACYTVTTVGILENSFGNQLTVYPNPTAGSLKIDMGQMINELAVSLHDVNGKLISNLTLKHITEFTINIEARPGVYLLTINSPNNKATIRVLKY